MGEVDAMARIAMVLGTGLFALSLLCCPQAGAQAARDSLALCGQVVLPALFPFFILSNLAVGLGLGQWLGRRLGPIMAPLFHVSGAGGAALALGLIGGYPVGAATVRTLLEQGTCTRKEAQTLLLFCNNAGPAFILSVAGISVFGSLNIGLLLLAVHGLSALLTGVLLRGKDTSGATSPPSSLPLPSASALLPQAVGKALSSSLQVSAYVVLFGVLLGLCRAMGAGLPPLPGEFHGLLAGLLELTNGISALPGISSPTVRLILCGFLLGWGGLSVHCQTAALLEGSGLQLAPYLRAKALQGLLSAGLLALAAPFCRDLLATSFQGQTVTLAELFPASLTAGAILWIIILILLTKGGRKSTPSQV